MFKFQTFLNKCPCNFIQCSTWYIYNVIFIFYYPSFSQSLQSVCLHSEPHTGSTHRGFWIIFWHAFAWLVLLVLPSLSKITKYISFYRKNSYYYTQNKYSLTFHLGHTHIYWSILLYQIEFIRTGHVIPLCVYLSKVCLLLLCNKQHGAKDDCLFITLCMPDLNITCQWMTLFSHLVSSAWDWWVHMKFL